MKTDNYPVPVLRPKLHRPIVARDVVPLEEQLHRLEAGHEQPLTVVSAPAGYGKSTLIASWLERRDGPSVWLSLDERDSDPRTFVSHFVAALRDEFPLICEELLDAIGGQDLPSSTFIGRLLANELDALGARVVIALDDYHRLQGHAVHDLLNGLLEHPPRGLHLVIVTRRDPPLRTRSLSANGRLTQVRIGDLRLGPAEAAAFLERATGRPVPGATAVRLHQGTEGWPAGLRLAALALRRSSDVDGLIHELDGGLLHAQQYMVREVLAQQPREMQDFLRRTSILGRMCAPLCTAVGATEGGDALVSEEQFIEAVETEGLFIVPLDDRGEWYRYHHLFQDLLSVELETRVTRAELSALHGRAARWLDDHGSLEEALPHYVLGAKPAEVEQAVVRHCRKMAQEEQWHRMANCLNLVPVEIESQSIEIQIVAALCADKRGRYTEMIQTLDRAEELLADPAIEDGGHEASRGRVEMMRAGLLAHLAQGREALERGEIALRLLPDEALGDRAYALIMVACGLQMTGELAKARLILGKESERRTPGNAAFRGQLLQARYLVDWMSADLPSLCHCATAGLELAHRDGLKEAAVWSRCYLGAALYHLGELEEAEALLDPVVRNRFGPSFHLHIMSVEVQAHIEQTRGRPDQARELVDSLANHLLEIGNESYREYLEALQVELDLRQGIRARAVRWARGFQTEARWAGYHFSVPELTAAKVLLFEGEDEGVGRAGRMLEELHAFYESSCNSLFLIETLALQALFFDARGDREEAVERLGQAIALARPSGFIRLFVDLGAGLAPLLHRLDLDEEGLKYVGRILSTLGAETKRDPVVVNGEVAQVPGLVEGLTQRELEVLSLLALHLSNKEIGTRLVISVETVKHHIKNLFGKLGVHSRRDAAAKATGLGILGDKPGFAQPPA